MRIAFLYHADNIHLLNRAKYLLNQGHEVFYFGFLPSESSEKFSGTDNLKRINIQKVPKLGKFNILNLALNIPHVRKLTIIHNIDILHIQNAGFGIFAPFSKAKVNILENMGSDVIFMAKKNILRQIIYRLCYSYVDAVIQDSDVAQEWGLKWGAPQKHNNIINIGIDFDNFNPNIEKGIVRKRLGLTPENKVVFSPRSFHSLYNIENIIKSIPIVKEKYDRVKFIFCSHQSNGSVDSTHAELINSKIVRDSIIFVGKLDNLKEMPYYYVDSDVVISVPFSDSSPLSVYEAMACKTPVIISELPWYKRYFAEGNPLVVVNAGDFEKLGQSIINVLDNPSIIDTQLAYSIVREKLNYKIENKKLEELYRILLNEHHAKPNLYKIK